MGLFVVDTGVVTTTASSTKSLLLLNPATRGIKLRRTTLSMDASTSSVAVAFQWYIVTTIGSPAGTTGTVNKLGDPNLASPTTTALTALTTEPTTVIALESWYVQPFGATYVVDEPLGAELMAAAGGARIGLRYITPAGVTPNMRLTVRFDEI